MSTTKISPSVPTDILEMEAAEQRRRLHNSVSELRAQVRHKLDVRRQLRDHVWPVAGVAAAVSLLLGFGSGRMIREMIG